jgi:uncharacterized protein (DUF362 family)
MKMDFLSKRISRRRFLLQSAAGILGSLSFPFFQHRNATAAISNPVFWIWDIPDQPFLKPQRPNRHTGVDALLHLMGTQGLKLHRSNVVNPISGPLGMIRPDDVVLIKVNAQWKYRGCTNSDLIRGLIQRILEHPEKFRGEVVIVENGQGRGSLNCDTLAKAKYPDASIQANANDSTHSFVYLVDEIFKDPRVSYYLFDGIRTTFIASDDHVTDGYRIFEDVSYPCFTTKGGRRVEWREGIWQGNEYTQDLKLINVPVLKHHNRVEITAALKHFFGVVSMADGNSPYRHNGGLGKTGGKMVVSVRTPVLNIMDAIWVSPFSAAGYPPETTVRVNQIMASQDPVALDYYAAKKILYPIDRNLNHRPDNPVIDSWLTDARDIINERGGLYNLDSGILVSQVTKTESEILRLRRRPWSG